MTNQFAKTSKLAAWLNKRDWMVQRDIDSDIAKYEREIEVHRVYATNQLILKLRRYAEEATIASNDKSNSYNERQRCATELSKIQMELGRLESTLSEGQRVG